MKPLIILTILLSLISHSNYSQSTVVPNSKGEINTYLAEGLECKELIAKKNKELRATDSTVSKQKRIIKNDSNTVEQYKKIESKLTAHSEEQEVNITKLTNDVNKQSNRKKRWRNIAIGEATLIAIAGFLSYLRIF